MKMIFDIETGPLPREKIAHLIPEFTAPSNYKDPDKIAANIAEQQAAWYAKAALHPMTGYVAAIGMYGVGGPLNLVAIEEDAMIGYFWNIYGAFDDMNQFVGHNIQGFDIPFLICRSWALGIKVPPTVMSGRYLNDRRFIDTMKAFQCGNHQEKFFGLDAVSKFFGLGGKTDPIGATFAEVLATDRPRALAYLAEDLEITRAVADRMGLL